MKPKFSEVTSLVLVDTLAALPMQHVVRMARLGHERLRHTCSFKWVTDRMTDVTFRDIVRAHQAGADVKKIFCSDSLMKRPNGKVGISEFDFSNPDFMKSCVEVTQKFGKLHLCLEGVIFYSISYHELSKFVSSMVRLCYLSQIGTHGMYAHDLMKNFPEMPFNYAYYPNIHQHFVFYRPALLNGRHVVDVLRAVCGPADVSEAELNRVRREATKSARNVEGPYEETKGVCWTKWDGVPVTVHV